MSNDVSPPASVRIPVATIAAKTGSVASWNSYTTLVIAAFRAALDGAAPDEVATTLAPALPAPPCNGYWHGRPGLEWGGPRVA